MAAVWLSILLTVACFSTLDAAIIKEEEQHGHHEAEHLLKNLMEQVLRELLQPEKDGKGKDGPGTWDNMPDNDEDQDQDDDKSGPSKKMMLQGKDGPNSWDNMPDFDEDDEDLDNDKGGHSKKMVLQHILRGDVERQPISFWNKTSLCDYHECFSKLKTWPEVPYYLVQDGNFAVDWPTKYIRQFMIYNTNAFVKVFNSDREAVKNHAMEATSAIDKVFRAFNFRVLLAGVDIIEDYWHGEEEEPDYYYLKPKVREYIWDKLRPANEFDSAVYISGPPYYRVYGGSGAGMGWVCEEPWVISGSSSIVSGRPADMLGILPHEMGHWIRGHAWDGLQHEGGVPSPCPGLKLFGAKCAMGGNQYPKTFSQNYFRDARADKCVKNKDILTKKPLQAHIFRCGNGKLDYGEECDCGSSQDCQERDPCCDGQICKLKQGSQCTAGQACCKKCKVDMESCPVDTASLAKRGWTQYSDKSTYTEITSPPSGIIQAIPLGKITPQNMVFSWLLRAPTGKKIGIRLIIPNLMSSYFEVWIGCPYDWVEVRDGGKATSPLIGRYCTPPRNNYILSSSNEMLVRLRSDSSFDSHFTIKYIFDPKGEEKQKPDQTCQTGNGASYRGAMDVTSSGIPCLGWDEHSRTYTKARYGEKYGLDKNYCRNPDNGNGVWCYIKSSFDDSYWDYCPVPKCGAPDVLSPEVQDLAKEAGECYKGDGSSYRGETALTWSGYPCRDWTSSGSNYKPTSYPDSDLTKNYCRNPSGGDDYAPWCYTAKPDYRKWEYCAIPKCMKDNEA